MKKYLWILSAVLISMSAFSSASAQGSGENVEAQQFDEQEAEKNAYEMFMQPCMEENSRADCERQLKNPEYYENLDGENVSQEEIERQMKIYLEQPVPEENK